MGATVIVVDTNQFRKSPMLRSRDWQELLSKRTDWDLRFAVPEVCLMEAISVVRRKWLLQRPAVAKLEVGEFDLSASQQDMLAAIDKKMEGYEGALRARLAEIGAEIIPIPESVRIVDLVQRAIDRRAPYPDGEGKKDGFRDTLIWHTTRGVAVDNRDCEVWLVSENHNDFGDKSEGDQEACPFPLHPHLVDELKTDGLVDRVSYVRTLGRLVQHLAGTYDALPAAERDALIERLDRDEFERQLTDVLLHAELSRAGRPDGRARR
jgi:hypothetical protein